MSTEAAWANGESVLPQARPAQNIEWAWANGESGDIGADEYVAVGGGPTPFAGPSRSRIVNDGKVGGCGASFLVN